MENKVGELTVILDEQGRILGAKETDLFDARAKELLQTVQEGTKEEALRVRCPLCRSGIKAIYFRHLWPLIGTDSIVVSCLNHQCFFMVHAKGHFKPAWAQWTFFQKKLMP